jgi:Flp pilus assembly pilin Flp
MDHGNTAKQQVGQALVEYVLIVTLVALVVIVGLMTFGPAVGNAFSGIINDLAYAAPGSAANVGTPNDTTEPGSTAEPDSTVEPGNTPLPSNTPVPAPTSTPITGVILSASAVRTGNGNGNSLRITITVSAQTTLTLIDSQGAPRISNASCTGTCEIQVPSIGKDAGFLAIMSASDGVTTVSYPKKG